MAANVAKHLLVNASARGAIIVIESDFSEKYNAFAQFTKTCQTAVSITLMAALVHHSPVDLEGQGRVHSTDAWIFASPEKKHDFDFHQHAFSEIIEFYVSGKGCAATDSDTGKPPIVNLRTDGCPAQYKGKRNFRFIADARQQIGVTLIHNFAATSHFKGCHDGIGGVAKNMMRRAEKFGRRIPDCAAVVDFLREKWPPGGTEVEDYFRSWSTYKIREVHIVHVRQGEVSRSATMSESLRGLKDTRKTYQFMRAQSDQKEKIGTSPAAGADIELDVKSDVEIVAGM